MRAELMTVLLALYRALLALLPRRARRHMTLLVPMMIMSAILEMVGLALILPLANAITDTQSFGQLTIVAPVQRLFDGIGGVSAVVATAAVVALFYVLKNAFLFLTLYAENRFVMTAVRDAAVRLLSTYLSAPYAFHLRHNSAELIRNLNSSVDDTFRGMVRPLVRMASEGFVILGIFLVLMLADPVVTITMGAFLGAMLGAFFLLTHRRVAAWGRALQRLQKENLQTLVQILQSIKEIRILRREDFFLKAFAAVRSEMSRTYILHQSVSELPRLAIETLLVLAFVMALVLLLARGNEGREALPLLTIYALAGFRLMPSFNRLILFANAVRFSSASLGIVLAHHKELAAFKASEDVGRADRLPLRQDLVLDDIVFCYEGSNDPILDHVTIRIAQGNSVGLVGASGAGKTTLANILLGLLEPQHGRVLVDGAPIGNRVAAWQRNIGYIPQQTYLLDDTLRRNIAMGVEDQDIDEERLKQAISLAQLDDVVENLPDGTNTTVGENGARLSGGQRQRVGIARALYHHPALLVMDEATAALDNETEREIGSAIGALTGGRTLVVIAHRLSTIRHCDTIVLLRDGRVADSGTYEELFERNAEFRQLALLGQPSVDGRLGTVTDIHSSSSFALKKGAVGDRFQ